MEDKQGDIFCGSCKYFEPAYIHDQTVYTVGSCRIKKETYIDAVQKEVIQMGCFKANPNNDCELYEEKKSFWNHFN